MSSACSAIGIEVETGPGMFASGMPRARKSPTFTWSSPVAVTCQSFTPAATPASIISGV